MYLEQIQFVGIELELESMTQTQIHRSLPSNMRFNIVHDGSIETDVTVVDNRYVTIEESLRDRIRGDRITIGAECTTPPLLIKDGIFDHICTLVTAAKSFGELDQSFRASLHVHISMGTGLNMLQAEAGLGGEYEDLFFRIGGMGYKHRGMLVNDCCYCRPITQEGPPIVLSGSGEPVKCFDLNQLKEATTYDGFWIAYGNDTGGDRYFPARYTWLNFHSHLQHSTLEFRVFNKCMNPFWIQAVVQLCQAFCRRAVLESISKEGVRVHQEHSVFNPRSTQELHDALEEFRDYIGDVSAMEILHNIINLTPPVTIPGGYIWTHLPDNYVHPFGRDGNRFVPVYVKSSSVRLPKVLEIHRLRGER